MRVFAHRGGAARAPENTRLAFERAAPHVDAIELDVRRCSSGELVVFHDETLDRLTDASGPVATRAWDELRTLTVLDSDETIPRLDDALASIPDEVAVNVELKTGDSASRAVAVCERVGNDVLVSSFDPAALEAVRARLPVGLLFSRDWRRNLERARGLGCAAVHPAYDLVLTDGARVRAAHDAGMGVNAWTVPTASAVATLRERGVDGVIVDDWDIVDDR
ncbi:MAG: glycerophosphodiester phosphodiesterase [Halobacteriota archaeon]